MPTPGTDIGGETAAGSGSAVVDLPARRLDDRLDRDELRSRYYGLLQELRVVLPGVQVLVAFLLTAPFSARFVELDDLGVATYLTALVCAVAATVCCIAPTVYHRAGGRTTRSARLVWAVRMTRVGFVLLAVSLLSAVFCVTRFVSGSDTARWVALFLAALLLGTWTMLPWMTASHRSTDDHPPGG
jgi:hypothetical protein